MPFTLNLASTPFGIPLNNAYAVINSVNFGCSVTDGKANEPMVTANLCFYANEAAYQNGGTPGFQQSYCAPLASPIMGIIETAVQEALAAVAGVTNAVIVNA